MRITFFALGLAASVLSGAASAEEEISFGCATAIKASLANYESWYGQLAKPSKPAFNDFMKSKYRKIVCAQSDEAYEIILVTHHLVTDHVVKYWVNDRFEVTKRDLGSD
jgi:hypothetical protein